MIFNLKKETARVKGLCFHQNFSLLLASLHTGSIYLYDYRMQTLVHNFQEHVGPVRGVDFHHSQPLFVSGGDDYKVKVWNFKLKKCLFTLQSHVDYVRTVEFHKEQPWIVSASDDQQIRIWNWQSRQCIACLSGHHHYVMCARFHPTQDLVVSCSLDHTIRVWDISSLKSSQQSSFGGGIGDELMKMSQINQDLFGTNEVMVRFILEGHSRGVNWVAFHPTMNQIISSGDDKTIRLWKFSDERAGELDSFEGHGNNVSCVQFIPGTDFIISNSEDKTIRLWNTSKSQLVGIQRTEKDRFWILAVHPSQNLIAAGHDSGFMIFKLNRERPAATTVKGNLLFIKDKYIKKYNFESSATVSLGILKTDKTPYKIEFSSQNRCLLVTDSPLVEVDKSSWELYTLPKKTGLDVENCKKIAEGQGYSAVFIGLQMIAILTIYHEVFIRSLNKDDKKRVLIDPSLGKIVKLHHAGSGRVLLQTEENVHLYDFEQKEVIASIAVSGVKFAIWSDDFSRVAFLSRNDIHITNSSLELQCHIQETVRIKSGAFDSEGVFIYTTLNHMKYSLPNSDSGTIRTLDAPIYIVRIESNAVHYLDRKGNPRRVFIDATEYRFKLALLQGKTQEIKKIIGNSKILGQSIIAYLQKKGFPSIAMKFVEDDITKFNLAIECGNIETAKKAAHKLDDDDCWKRLGTEALRQGDLLSVQKSYLRTKNFDALTLLSFITGNEKGLKNNLSIARQNGDVMSEFHTALYLGDVETRVQILKKAGQVKLAYVTAKTHGLEDLANEIKKSLPENWEPPAFQHDPILLQPPVPVYQPEEINWPLLHTTGDVFESDDAEENLEEIETEGWDNLNIPGLEDNNKAEETQEPLENLEENGELGDIDGAVWDDLEGIGDLADIEVQKGDAEEFAPPSEGISMQTSWIDNSRHPADHVAAGSFASAMEILQKALGIKEFKPLLPYFLQLRDGTQAILPLGSNLPSLQIPIQRTIEKTNEDKKHNAAPALSAPSFSDLEARFKQAQQKITSNQFDQAQEILQEVIIRLLFIIVENRNQDKAYHSFLEQCTEYLLATNLDAHKRKVQESDPKKSMEYAAYFTRCKLSKTHLILGVTSAMAIAYKHQNFATAVAFAKRLLKMGPPTSIAKKATYIQQQCKNNPQDKYEIDYDERNQFYVCGKSLQPIYRGSQSISCSYCKGRFLPKYGGILCSICQIGTVGETRHASLYEYATSFKD